MRPLRLLAAIILPLAVEVTQAVRVPARPPLAMAPGSRGLVEPAEVEVASPVQAVESRVLVETVEAEAESLVPVGAAPLAVESRVVVEAVEAEAGSPAGAGLLALAVRVEVRH